MQRRGKFTFCKCDFCCLNKCLKHYTAGTVCVCVCGGVCLSVHGQKKSQQRLSHTQAKLVCACSPVICHTESHQHYPLTSLVELFDEAAHSKSCYGEGTYPSICTGVSCGLLSLSCVLVDLIRQAHILLLAVQATSSSRMLRFLSSYMLLSMVKMKYIWTIISYFSEKRNFR